MKKVLILIVNVIIMAAILTFVAIYSGFVSRESYQRQIENFENLQQDVSKSCSRNSFTRNTLII